MLLVDSDPQGNLTKSLVTEEHTIPGLYEALDGGGVSVHELSEYLHLLSGDFRLSSLEKSLVGELESVAPRPQIAIEACEYLNGKQPSKRVFKEASMIAKKSAQPITDIRGTKEYRYELVEVLTRRALEEALMRAQNNKK